MLSDELRDELQGHLRETRAIIGEFANQSFREGSPIATLVEMLKRHEGFYESFLAKDQVAPKSS
jgi:hypothetical protein